MTGILNLSPSLLVSLLGGMTIIYIMTIYFSKKSNRDLSCRLESWWHVKALEAANIPPIRLFFIFTVFCSFFMFPVMLIDFASTITDSEIDFPAMLDKKYLPSWAGWSALFFSLIFQLCWTNKGLAFSIGNRLSLSFDKGSVLAFHLDELNPNIRAQAKNIISAITTLRARGNNNRIVIKSFLCISKMQGSDIAVQNIRRLFNESSDFSVWVARKYPHIKIYFSKMNRGDGEFYGRLISMVKKIASPIATIIYIAMHVKEIKNTINNLPPASIAPSTRQLMIDIHTITGEVITPITPAPVSIIEFINLSVKLPHVGSRFSGFDGGFMFGPR